MASYSVLRFDPLCKPHVLKNVSTASLSSQHPFFPNPQISGHTNASQTLRLFVPQSSQNGIFSLLQKPHRKHPLLHSNLVQKPQTGFLISTLSKRQTNPPLAFAKRQNQSKPSKKDVKQKEKNPIPNPENLQVEPINFSVTDISLGPTESSGTNSKAVSDENGKSTLMTEKILPSSGPLSFLQSGWRRLIRQLASFPLAIGMLAVIAGLCSIGTVIEQNESLATYMEYYPEERPILGFINFKLIMWLQFDHIYTSPYFLSLLGLLAFSLVACTATRQWPMVKVAQRWQFVSRPEAIKKMAVSASLERARIGDLSTLLAGEGFQVFFKGSTLYAFKGLVGRIAPIGVHFALLLVMGGGLYTAIGGYRGSTMTPQGLEFYVGDTVRPNGFLSWPTNAMNLRVRVNKFYIDYRDNGEVKQFFSDLSMIDLGGRELLRKTISVNDPFRCNGVTLYQTDWSISAIQVRVDGSDPFNLPAANLAKPGSSQKLYGTFLPLGDVGLDQRKGISILAQDLQNVVVYDSSGQFVGVRRPGSNRPITVEGVNLVFDDIIGSSGMELKMDPSIPYVYAGFGGLMLTSAISFLSHSQVWALQEGSTLYVGGKSNRARLAFEQDLNTLLDLVPEIIIKTNNDGDENGVKEVLEEEEVKMSPELANLVVD